MTSFHVVVLFLRLLSSVISENALELTLVQGKLRGTIRTSLKGRPILSYQGIPYAEPPIGQRRFKPPVALKRWDGILDATKSHNYCPQDDVFFRLEDVHGDEDCLFLNVYTPKISKKLLPVIVYIHGGGFVMGNSNPSTYGPDFLLDKDVIFVTLNYRLGALGFLSTEDDVVPGNNGLKDQSLALHWVKNNIIKFGGNPEKITVFGHSAGSASAYYHLLSPLSKDIIFAGISSSGIVAQWSLSQKGEAIYNARKLARHLNCSTTSNKEMIECLRHVDAHDIVKNSNNFRVFNNEPCIIFKPVVEIPNDGAFMPKNPIKVIREGKMANVPFMTGVTTEDGAFKSASIYNDSSFVKEFDTHFYKYLPVFVNYNVVLTNASTDTFINDIKKKYFNDKDLINSPKSALTDLATDALFMYPTRSVSALHAKYSKKPAYFYLFGYRGKTSLSTSFGDPTHDYGVCHGDDMLYLISSDFVDFKPNENDKRMIEFMTQIWFNFASTGNPTLNSEQQWSPITSDNCEYLAIQNYDKVKMKRNLYEDRYEFWKNLEIPDYIAKIDFDSIVVKDEL